MRLLVFADLHLDSVFAWAPRAVARDRRESLRQALKRICDLAADLGVDALCCAGDLYEQERFSPDTAAFLRGEFARLAPMPVLLAPGNHDWFGPASLYHQVPWTPNVRIFTEPRLRPLPLADGFTIWGAAHVAPATTAGFLDAFHVRGTGVHIGLFHGSEQGELAFEQGKRPHAPFRASQVRGCGLHHALVGHFHTPRDAAEHTYPGNPEPLTFGETGERGPVLVTVAADGSVTRQRFAVGSGAVHDVQVSVDGVEHSGELAPRVAAVLAGLTGVARVTLAGEVAPGADISLTGLADAAPDGLVVVPRLGAISVRYDLDALAAQKTMQGEFVRLVQAAADLTEDERRRVLTTGLRALDGRTDLEVH